MADKYPSTLEVLELFDFRCPKCRRSASTVHELEPRARGARTMRMQNRVATCRPCHDEFHRKGASEENIATWKIFAQDYLISIGKWEEYCNYGKEH